MKQIISFLLVAFLSASAYAKMNTDSLRKLIEVSDNDTVKAGCWNLISLEYSYSGYYELAESAAYQALDLSRHSSFRKGEADAYYHLGISYSKRNQYDKAVEWFLKAITAYDKLGNARGKGFSIMLIAVIDYNLRNYSKSEEEYKQALDIFTKANLKDGIANCLVNLGFLYADKGEYTKAIDYSEKAYAMFKEGRSPHGMAECMSNIANVFTAQYRQNDSTGNKDIAAEYLSRAAKAYTENIQTYKELGMPAERTQQYVNIFNLYLRENPSLAKTYLDTAAVLANEVNSLQNKYLVSYAYYQLSLTKKDSASALRHFLTYTQLRDSVFNSEKAEKLKSLSLQIREIEKEKEIHLIRKEKEKETLILWSVAIVSVLLLFSLLLLFRRYTENRRANNLLAEKNKTIENKNKEIIDSINYARHIQQAVLLPESDLRPFFTDIFVLYKPKDIVSGDFYWFAETSRSKVLAVADCTGHGVPGGFMSMIGYEMLQDVLLKDSVETTSQALTALDKKLTDSLNKSGKSFRDGMDMALCAFSKQESKVQYSGANRPLLHVSGGKMQEYKPDKNTLGGNLEGIEKTYQHLDINLAKGDMLYLFSDGYADQFGGPGGKKFKSRQLHELLLSISNLDLKEQKQRLEEAFNAWKGAQEQVDDICIVGIRA